MVESLARSYEKEYWEQHKDEEYDSDRFSEFLEAVQRIDYNTLRDLPYRDANYRPIIMIETDLEI